MRTRLLLCLRFAMLCPNVYLERMHRTFSLVDGQPFVLMQRKGWKFAQRESIMTMPDNSHMCPWALLKRYVALTAHQCPRGSYVFRSSNPPFHPLKANSIGSLTRQALSQLGVDTSVWKPHPTRGAGVAMYKSLGLSSEEVCEIGKWKNVGAFTSHYL